MTGTPAAAVMALRRSATMMACSSFSIAQGPPMRTSGPPPPIVIPPTRTVRLTAVAGLRPSLMVERRANEAGEERMGIPRARAELGVELARHEPWMPRQLDDLHQLLLRPHARDPEPALLEPAEIVVVDLVPVAMALLDGALAVESGGRAPLLQRDGIEAQPHGAALGGDPALLGQEIDHIVRGLGIELRGVGAGEAAHIARVLDHRALQPQADAEEGHL